MDHEEIFLNDAKARAYERLRKQHAPAAQRLEQLFRRQITAVGFSAHRLLDVLDISHRDDVSLHYLPGRVVFVRANADRDARPHIETLNDLLTRGGTVILEGKVLPALSGHEHVIRIFTPLFPRNYPETNPDDAVAVAAYKRAVDRWAKKYCDLVKVIAEAL